MDGWTPPWNRITSAPILIGLTLLAPTLGSAQVSAAFSFYVPQAGSVTTPLEGNPARAFFRACPNNDGGSSLPNSARIKVVVRDIFGSPMDSIPADSICAMFSEADTIIAGSPCDTTCPNIECLTADAPTDINGVTYITFTGALPSAPGVGVRDPNRKWGHYAPEIPVRVKGVEIPGRLTTPSPSGSYVLQIKNFDLVGGLAPPCIPGEVESVDASDLAAFVWCTGGGPCPPMGLFWMDFDWSGTITAADFNMFISHLGHNCTNPFNP